ncbi:DNA polymerase subunit beta [Metallosphaera tengchongensis]|uniref:protein adenylyltransferase n=1 Tax=Metallosphaera tengchongensis TaxID=1532350 RepID=A0A6N0NUB0_9CREN|nr:nucleotidyltransferase domain-containing protein [Metallosphaera tengchongensis]QKQ99744.1 DNA polymerase subunit beta [Metallosphaera tengchongensis]
MQIVYDEVRWKTLGKLRERAIGILKRLNELSMVGYVYGSVARGDVNPTSDIDIVVLNPNVVLLDLIHVDHKFIIQATPTSTPKVYLALDRDEKEVISFPLVKLRGMEEEFYKFGGMIGMEDLERGLRVVGVNKNLDLIVPNKEGHDQIPLKGNEDIAIKYLKISPMTLDQREKLLTRRREQGRTGTFLRYELSSEESVQTAVRDLMKENKFFKRSIDRG